MGARGPLPRTATAGAPAPVEPLPPPPDYLPEPARAEYLRIAAVVPGLSAADATLLATYAQAVHEHAELSRRLTPETMTIRAPTGGEYLHPLFTARSTCQKTLERCAAALGLSPAARARSGAPTSAPSLHPGPGDGFGPA